ncbi:MAG TPA: carboxypeptidase regulatory-like domain-containing protein [Bryobacteraceae bacterium]|nr:carboxypeptidase regulatory-like domain-containing protein [Bryobacteraceae bacterium]
MLVKRATLAVCLLVSTSLFAQFETSEVLGTVHDPSGSPVPSANVTLTNQDTNIEMKTTTNSDGNYDFFNVKVGRYTVAVEASGFSKASATDITITVGTRQRVDLTMQVGAITESVTVTGAASALETDSSEHGQVISTQAVAELPLNGRNYAELALLSTNAVKSPIAVSFSPSGTPREGAFNVNGMRSTYNNFLLDGLDNNAYGTSNQGYSAQVVQPSPDAIAEFKVITSNYSAEYGRVGGAVVNAVMRSGTNQFHGTAYEFIRNTDLNAGGYEFSQPFVKPPLQRNQFGATIGGPIIKNKLFFFGDYEGYRQLQHYPNFDSLPNANDRAGILPVTVVNPLTGVVYPANTQIPIASLNPFAAAVLHGLPPNTGPGRASDYQANLLIRDYGDKYDAKVDGQINDRMTAFLRFSQRKDLQYYQPSFAGPSGGDGNGYIHATDQNASAGYTWTPTATSVLEVRLGFSHTLAGKQPPFLGGPSLQSLYGIQGLPTTPNLTGGLNSQSISGFTAFGRQTSNPQFQNPTSWDPKINFSKVLGRHSLKAGYEFSLIHTEILDVNPLYGQDQYTGNFSKPTCAQLGQVAGCSIPSDSASYNLADFIFGTPSIISQGSDTVVNLRQYVHSLYVQDDYRVTQKLTLNLGLRWEFASPLYERDNNYSNFDPTTNSMKLATGGDLYQRSLVHPDYKDYGPRVGWAFSIDPKTVVRGGYGISYTFFNRPGSALEGINAPQALFGVLNQSIPPGGPVPASFLTTQNSFTTGIANPSSFNPVNSNVVYIPPNMKWPYVQNWFLSVQRELAKDTVIELAYNGNHSLRLPILADYNQASPNLPGQTLGVQVRRPIPTFGPITWVDPAGNNDYNGFSARVEHRFAKGLYFLNSFTWGKAMGDSEQALEYYAGYVEANPQNIRNLAAERGPSSFDVKLNNVTSVVYQLPFGKGRTFGSSWNPVLDALAGGWELNGINTAHTGTPLNVYYSPSTANDVTGLSNDYRGQAFERPNVTGSATSQGTAQMINTYFAGYTFTTPPASAPFGNVGRNAFRAPSFEQWDLAVDKNFRIVERMRLQFRSEFFNVLNHTNFGIPTTQTTSVAFGQIRTAYPPRQIQLALKLIF